MQREYPIIPSDARDTGFTLLETLIALAILAIALVAVFRLHYQSIDLSAEIAFNAKAPFLAGRFLSNLEQEGIDGTKSDAGRISEEPPPYAYKVDITEVELPLGEATPPKLWQIDVAISAGERLTYHLTTFRRNKE